jgi:L-ascorbate metabolism protein UlaG (beta-lactamase superfamily)
MPKMNELTKRIRSNPFDRNFSNAKTLRSKREVKPSVPIKPVDQRLPPKVLESVMSILVSVQWDRWRFMLPAKPLLKLDVAVVSHGHADHWHPNFWSKDVVVTPLQVSPPHQYKCLRNIIRIDDSLSLGRLKLRKIGRRELAVLLKADVETPHAFWWLAESPDTRVLFVGDMNLGDVRRVERFMAVTRYQDPSIRCVILPSFGGMDGHGGAGREVCANVKSLAFDLSEAYNVLLGALPHPISADWADFNAVRA